MATQDLRQFLRTYGRYRQDGMHHRQRAGAFILVTLLLFSFSAHEVQLDAAMTHMMAVLGTNCAWCSVTPY
ncbi:hypothetical protein [Herbaspirillum rhizosphaerae]|uniref:hypothetical protein n=1 Tax=Herbaspirillum rhizosphaerae TaxID=346179 RepID=UPI00067C5AC6|nr:hypothetical protein [Herbaspirillum rhizosphaerae]